MRLDVSQKAQADPLPSPVGVQTKTPPPFLLCTARKA